MSFKIPQIRVKAILNNSNNEILLSIVNENDTSSKMRIPVRNVLYDESAEVSVKRLVLESTFHQVEPIAILGIYSEYDLGITNHFVTAVFICIVTEFNDVIRDGIIDYQWLDTKRLSQIELDHNDTRILIDYRDWRIHKSTYWTSKVV